MFTAVALASLALTDPQPLTDVFVYADRVEFHSVTPDTTEREVFWFGWAPVNAEVTIDDCVASAQIACGTHGIAWLRYRHNKTTGDDLCEFGCNTTGSGS